MYIPRNIDRYLMEWKKQKDHKPLLLRGARQVGKSFSIRHLGETFESYIEVNFEKHPELKEIFVAVSDVHEIANRLALIAGKSIEPGKTLLFLDEIQACTPAIKSLWAFKEDFPELHVIAAGSLLEFTLKDLSSFGVGRVRSLFMYPLSFNEFLVAQGKGAWLEEKQKSSAEDPLFEVLHNELVQQFRTFLMVGGMPASVAKWVETHNYAECQAEQDDIQLAYYDDFAKYSRKIDPTLLRNTLQSVVLQIGKKFVYSKVEGGYKADEVKKALQLLCDAGIVKRVSHTAANGLPLGAEVNDKFRKYIYLDSGLLLRILDMDFGGAQQLTELIVTGAAEDLVNKGSLTEMVLGWEFVKYENPRAQLDLYYWENTNDGTSAEVDYILVRDMNILPVECKSGTSGKMKSLRLFMQHKKLPKAVRSSLENFSLLQYKDQDDSDTIRNIEIIPLYSISNLF